jgi:hypothetical protein
MAAEKRKPGTLEERAKAEADLWQREGGTPYILLKKGGKRVPVTRKPKRKSGR